MTITNRSPFVVSVKNNEAVRRDFPFNKVEAVKAYLEALHSKGFKSARADQLESHLLVRIRKTGYPDINQTFSSYDAAERFETQVMAERSQGVFIDYSKSMHSTVAKLIRRFIVKELPRKKGGKNYLYFFQAMLDDSDERLDELESQEREARRARAVRSTMGSLEWVHKPLTEVTAEDIEDWMHSREGDVAQSTIWREYEHIRGMINLAINTWGYSLRINPTLGVRRWEFQNERNRRLVGDEFDRIMAAARQFDAARSLELRVQELMAQRLADKTFNTPSHRKHLLVAARKEVSAEAAESYLHRPVMEAFVLFQLATGARRGESLTLPWKRVDFEKKTAFLPETKNGRARTLALRDDLIELLKELPRDADLLFGLTVKTCTSAWKSILQAAGVDSQGDNKLTVHDLRHEAISAAAESGMSIVELQAFSGHRDARMLQRYTHLCMTQLADKLSAAFASGTIKNGRRRQDPKVLRTIEFQDNSVDQASCAPVPAVVRSAADHPSTSNVIIFPGRRHRAA